MKSDYCMKIYKDKIRTIFNRVNKLFDSLFRIYELKNNYHKRYGKKNYDDLTTPKNSLFNLINNNE